MLPLLSSLTPIIGMVSLFSGMFNSSSPLNTIYAKYFTITTSIVSLFVCIIMFISFDFSLNQFQFVQNYYDTSTLDLYLGLDGLSLYFIMLITIIIPISLLSNWISITSNIRCYLIVILLLEILLSLVFFVLDIFLFYVFFESILSPLFILIGLFGSNDRVRAGFYLFLYTLFGSLFLLLSIIAMSSTMGNTDFTALCKTNFKYFTQLYLFYGIFIAFAVKTPTIFLNIWLLKAHVESPLGGSIILAAIVLKLSLYGILRLILPYLAKASLNYTYVVYLIGVITVLYASVSTIRTIDVKELIAYSSVCHAAVYLLGVLSNTIQGLEGGILLGLAHGFVSSGLFICAGGVLYDRSSTRLITYFRGLAQIMPLFSILFFILSLGNCGVPLTLNFVGEFMSLYGVFERLPLAGVFASTSIIFSAAYTIYMFNRVVFGGSYSKFFEVNLPDLNKRELYILLTLVVTIVVLGVYPIPVLNGLHYNVSSLIYSGSDFFIINSNLSYLNDYVISPLSVLEGKARYVGDCFDNAVSSFFSEIPTFLEPGNGEKVAISAGKRIYNEATEDNIYYLILLFAGVGFLVKIAAVAAVVLPDLPLNEIGHAIAGNGNPLVEEGLRRYINIPNQTNLLNIAENISFVTENFRNDIYRLDYIHRGKFDISMYHSISRNTWGWDINIWSFYTERFLVFNFHSVTDSHGITRQVITYPFQFILE